MRWNCVGGDGNSVLCADVTLMFARAVAASAADLEDRSVVSDGSQWKGLGRRLREREAVH